MFSNCIHVSTHGFFGTNYLDASGKFLARQAVDTGGQVNYVLSLAEAQQKRSGMPGCIVTRDFEGRSLSSYTDGMPNIEQLATGVDLIGLPAGHSGWIPKEKMGDVTDMLASALCRYCMEMPNPPQVFISHYWDGGVVADLAVEKLRDEWDIPPIIHLHVPHSVGLLKRIREHHSETLEAERQGREPRLENIDRIHNFHYRLGQERAIYTKADAVICTASEQVEALRSYYEISKTPIHLIPVGVDLSEYRGQFKGSTSKKTKKELLKDKLEIDLPEDFMDRPLIVNGGRLCDNKGFDLLVRTARSVVDRRPDAVFLLTMSYSSSCDQEQASFVELQGLVNDLKLKDNVFLNPSVSKDVYNLIFSSADVVGGTNRFEGFGMYFTEAAAAGVPLVVSKHTGLAQNHLVHETSALIIDPYEFDATADALLRVLSDEVFAQKLRRNAEKVVRSLDWNEIAGQFSEVVDGLLSHPKKPSLNLQNLPGAIIYGR